MNIYFASGNAHKLEEINRIMREHAILTSPFPCNAEETADTFLGNAEIKARDLYAKLVAGQATTTNTNQATASESPIFPVLADDSGLVIPALNGAPGIYSARYGSAEAGRPLTQAEKNQLVLKQMEKFPAPKDRRCYFVAALVLILDEERIISVQERFEGVIAHEPIGTGGFGYDPIVYLPKLGRSVAELTEAEKDTISHRGLAGAALQRILSAYLA